MEGQRRFSRGRFLRLSAMTAGGVVLAGCNLQEGGNLPGANRGKGGDGSVDLGEIRAPGNSQALERLAEDWKPYDGEPVELSVWMYVQNENALAAYKKARCGFRRGLATLSLSS